MPLRVRQIGQTRVDAVEDGLQVVAFEGATPFYLQSARGSWVRAARVVPRLFLARGT